MFSIVIDFSKIVIDSKLTLLGNKIKPFPINLKHTIGLILTIPNELYEQLLEQDIGINRITFINTPLFVDSIIDYTYFQYDSDMKICELHNLHKINCYAISSVLESLLYYIPNDVTISASIQIQNKKLISKLISENFKNPIISNKSSIGNQFEKSMLFLSKLNDIMSYDATNEVTFKLLQYKTKSNILQFRFENETIRRLKYFSKIGNSINNDKTITQKEITGCFNVQKMDNQLVYILQFCDESFKLGTEEGAEIISCRFSFHSHPFGLYDVYKFKLGWPSNFDYLAYLYSVQNHTLFHIVISNEGIYIISLSDEWSKNTDFRITDELNSFILDKYKIRKTDSDLTLKKYINKINGINYKNKRIFNMEFRSWNHLKIPFSVFEPCVQNDDK